MCAHCESRVKNGLEAVDGVTDAKVSHLQGNAKVTMSHNVDNLVLKAAVEKQGYTVLSVE